MPFDPEAFLARHDGDVNKALSALAADGFRDREKRRETEQRLEEAESALKAYAELGKPDELTAQLEVFDIILESLQAIGAPINETERLTEFLKVLPERLKAADSATSKLATLERQQVVRDAADALGWDAKRLEKLLKDAPLEVKTEKRDGKDVTTYHVKDGEGTVALEEAFQDFLPALTAQSGGNGNQQDKKQAVYAGPGTRDAKPPTAEELAAQKRATGEYTI